MNQAVHIRGPVPRPSLAGWAGTLITSLGAEGKGLIISLELAQNSIRMEGVDKPKLLFRAVQGIMNEHYCIFGIYFS